MYNRQHSSFNSPKNNGALKDLGEILLDCAYILIWVVSHATIATAIEHLHSDLLTKCAYWTIQGVIFLFVLTKLVMSLINRLRLDHIRGEAEIKRERMRQEQADIYGAKRLASVKEENSIEGSDDY